MQRERGAWEVQCRGCLNWENRQPLRGLLSYFSFSNSDRLLVCCPSCEGRSRVDLSTAWLKGKFNWFCVLVRGTVFTFEQPKICDDRFFTLLVCFQRYGYHQREITGSPLFTEVKLCWTGLISGFGDHLDKIPRAVLLGKSGWRSGHQSRLPPLLQCCMWSSFSRSQPDFEGFLQALRFPPSSKLTPSSIQYAGPH